MEFSKENIIYILTFLVAFIGAVIPFLQAVESIVSYEYASQIALMITILGLGVPLIIKIIAILDTQNELKRAELKALQPKKVIQYINGG